MGRYLATLPTLTDEKVLTEPLVDVNGREVVTQGTLVAGEDLVNNRLLVQAKFSPTYISTAATTLIKTGSGVLHTVVVQGGTTGTVVIYDNTAASGTILASFDTTNALATYTFDVSFGTGLTVVTSAATKLTVSSL